MFLLLGVMAAWEDAGDRLCDWFAPALEWIQRWMALFYAPFLVALPANAASLIGQGISAVMLHTCARSALTTKRCCLKQRCCCKHICIL